MDIDGNFISLPENGGYYNQDETIMRIWCKVQSAYKQIIDEKIDKVRNG
jgi:hypothetical protein